uniref:Nodulin-like domain-containing protein n=1 Tax=Pseudictyota dubia TaxID=2749911 RepID=A0A7R9ZER6_9STRA|mmetsp:Transcript_42129/g.77991  ORF Transcript_42129/g.77991 Transcript_42129/m.77991 type:complete len:752 (+) Transcript_42129:601-2856(+)|eukprot:CAMPEP_0197441768 /NCGR_PEP_ID=MMETSP1175-20131217/7949_1 /TAXON_ID=1003142 /ORGANISM="Triceratium dubium, Strain CCMP147" /LENGTH=751 /DNA_ID=CAMNT_0042972099 /DNA_START=489 /DNA_END=2744 /DNA_ORIENTATION=-
MTDLDSDSSSVASESEGRLALPTNDDSLDDERFLVDHSDAAPGSECGDDPNPSSTGCYDIPLRGTNLPALTGAILAAGSTGGVTYAFGIYSNALKHTLHLTQGELDTISSASFCAGLFSWAPGMVADKFGPRRSLAIGEITMALSLLGFWVVSRQDVIVPRSLVVPLLSGLGVGSFLSSALVTGAVFKLIVASTGPGTKGSAVGAAKGYVGLGAGAYACLFEALRGGGAPPPSAGEGGGGGGNDTGDVSDLNFLPMAAIMCLLLGTVPAICLLPPYAGMTDPNPRRKKPVDAATPSHFRSVYAGLIGLGTVVVGASILELHGSHKDHSHPQSDVSVEDHHSGKAKKFGDTDFGRAALILCMWILPILAMLWIPRRRKSERAERAAYTDGEREAHNSADESLVEETTRTSRSSALPQRLQRGNRRRGRGARYSKVGAGDEEDSDGDDVGYEEEEIGLADEEGSGSVAQDSAMSDGDESENQEEYLIADEETRDRHEGSRHPSSSSSSSAPRPLGELPLSGMLKTSSAWLLLWTCTILCGGGTVMTNNLGQMAEALRLDPDTAPAALALFSAAQAAGRVCTGSMSEVALNWKRRIPRPAFLIVASVFCFFSHVVLAFARTELWFVIGVTMTGWAFGMIWPLMVLITGETFGTKNVGANYMFYDGLTSAAGTLLLSKFVAQEVYESHIHPREHSEFPGEDAGEEWGLGTEDDGLTCYGMGCFQMCHVVVAGLSVTCLFSSAALVHKTRGVYERR